MTLSEVLQQAGRDDDAKDAVTNAIAAAESKGHLVRARLARELAAT